MIEAIISRIKEAEKLAEELTKKADDEAKAISAASEKQVIKTARDAGERAKLAQKRVLGEFERLSEKQFDERVAQGKKAADELFNSVSKKIEEEAAKVVKKIIS